MSFGGAKETTKTDTNQKTDPWAPAQDGLKGVLAGAQNWMTGADQRHMFGGQTYAGMSDPTKAGLATMAQGGGPNTQMASSYYGDVLGGKYLNSGNPQFQSMADSVRAGVMPGINATFSKAGMTGSDPHQYALAKGLGDAMAPIAWQNYQGERGAMGQAAAAAPGLDAQRAQGQIAAGQGGEGYEQKAIDEQMARYNYEQNKPLLAMQQASGLINPIAGMGSTMQGNTTAVKQQQQSPMQTALGLGLMGASLMGTGGMFPGAGTAMMGGLSGLMGGGGGGGGAYANGSMFNLNNLGGGRLG